MANGTLLVNPELNPDDVTVTHSAALGREIGVAVADAGNSEQLRVVTSGDPGDDDTHTFRVDGSQDRPTYRPDNLYTNPTAFSRHVAQSASGIRHAYVVTAFDMACVVNIRKTGTNEWTLGVQKVTATGVTVVAQRVIKDLSDSSWNVTSLGATVVRGGTVITAAIFIKDIVNSDGRLSRVRWFRINMNADSPGWATLGTVKITTMIPGLVEDTDYVSMDGHLDICTDGKVWVLAFQIRETSDDIGGTSTGDESQVFICTGAGPLGVRFERKFGGTATEWWWQPKLYHSPHWGFVLTATRAASDTTTRNIRTRHSKDGSTWENLIGAPGVTARVFNDWGVAVATENRRVYLYWNEGDGTDDTKMVWFNGDEEDASAWSAITAVNVGAQLDGDSFVAATNWRGEIWVTTRASSGGTATDNIEVIRTNTLTATNTGIERELVLGEKVFIDGVLDDSMTALFVTATGSVIPADSWTIGVQHQFEGKNVLRESLNEEWRTDDNGTPNIVFDAREGRAFVVDGVGLFNINLPAWTFQMNDSDSWGTPTVSQSVSAVVSTATVSSVKGNRVVITTSPWERAQFARRIHWAELSTGIFKILDNGEDYLVVDGDPGSATGTVTVFGDRAGHLFGSLNIHRYARLLAPSAKEVPDDFYRIGRVLFGAAFALPQDYAVGWREGRGNLNEALDLRGGGRAVAPINNRPRNEWSLSIPPAASATAIMPLRDFQTRAGGNLYQVAWWPEGSGDAKDVYVARLESHLTSRHVMGAGSDRFDELAQLFIAEEIG